MNRIQLLSGTPYKKAFLGWGTGAIYNTIEKMRGIVNASIGNPYVRRWSEKIIADDGTEPNDKIGEIQAIYKFVRDNTRYTRDPYGLEYLQSPQTTLKLLEYGETPMVDCDDSSLLTATLLKSIGFPVALKVASYTPDRKYSHIYVLVYNRGRWIALDAVKRNFEIGYEVPDATKYYEKVI